MNLVAWSYSRLSSFETCPRKFWNESVAKTVPFVKSEQALYGDLVHKCFELYFKDAKPLPLNLKHWTPTLQFIASAPGEKTIEARIALNKDYEFVEWRAKDAWLRVKSDLTQVHGPYAAVWDWKTGKPRDDDDQLKLNAAVTFLLDPDIQEISMAYLWLQTKTVTKLKMTQPEAVEFWGEILPRVAKYQDAHDKNEFPPRPCFLCRGWCPVKTCEFHESRS
jgi:CRISPR/Cas system-associated exonuclease Cas4 (RecB family)